MCDIGFTFKKDLLSFVSQASKPYLGIDNQNINKTFNISHITIINQQIYFRIIDYVI